MTNKALFIGLVFDEYDRPVEAGYVGDEPCYIINDQGFRRHIPSEQVDSQVLEKMREQIEGNEELLTEQAVKMMGQDDLFSHAIILNQLKNLDKQFDQLLKTGIPEDMRLYLGMMGFRIVINFHGEVIRFDQPAAAADE